MEALIGLFLVVFVFAIALFHLWPEIEPRLRRALVDWSAAKERSEHDARMTNVMLKMRAIDRETYARIESAERNANSSS